MASIENSQYINGISSFVSDQKKRLKKCLIEFDKNCIFEILKFTADLNSHLKLDVNFKHEQFVTNKGSESINAITLGMVIGYLNQIRSIVKKLVEYQSKQDNYGIKTERRILATILTGTYVECHRLLYLYDVELNTEV
jgi:hypothetical protein